MLRHVSTRDSGVQLSTRTLPHCTPDSLLCLISGSQFDVTEGDPTSPRPFEAPPPGASPPRPATPSPAPSRPPWLGGSGASPPRCPPATPLPDAMTTSLRPAHSYFSGGTQAGPRAPAWGPQLPPPPSSPPRPRPALRLLASLGPAAGVPPRRPSPRGCRR